jgi:hypothetical protein
LGAVAPRHAARRGRTAHLGKGGASPARCIPPEHERQRKKKVISGSETRRRQHLERFRTDDVEHEALHARRRASGKSLGAFVMDLAAIDGDSGSRARLSRGSASIDSIALTKALVELNRVGNNINQIARALNELALIAHEQSSRRLESQINDLTEAIYAMPDTLAIPLAAIHAAMNHDREG